MPGVLEGPRSPSYGGIMEKEIPDRLTTVINGKILYSYELNKIIFQSDTGYVLAIVNLSPEELLKVVSGKVLPVCAEVRY